MLHIIAATWKERREDKISGEEKDGVETYKIDRKRGKRYLENVCWQEKKKKIIQVSRERENGKKKYNVV